MTVSTAIGRNHNLIAWGWGLGWTDHAFLHHVTCARHGVPRGQIDISARVISLLEKLGWVSDVRWTNPTRLGRITATNRPDRAPGCPERGDDSVTAGLASVSTIGSSPMTTAQPDPHPATQLLTVTARLDPPDAVVLAVRGEVDMSTSPHLQHVLLSHLHDAVRQVTVDLTGVSFLSAAGLTVLVNVKQTAVAAGSSLRLVARTRVVLLPLTITGLDGEFDIYPELADVPPFPGGGPDG